jgi:hypothetical protein
MKLPYNLPRTLFLLIASLLCSPLFANQETDWLELQEGYEGEVIGAKVTRIEEPEGENNKRITVAIPKSAIKSNREIEEIVVIGKVQKKAGKTFPINITYEWADDYDNDYYGLIITLGKATNLPIRLYLKDYTEAP